MQLNTKPNVANALLILLIVGYPVTAMASASLFEETTGLNLYQALYAFVMGFWGAVASLSSRFASGTVRKKWGIVILSDTINSTLAATLVYMFCAHMKISPALMGIFCTLAGFGGIKFMDWAYAKFMQKADQTV